MGAGSTQVVRVVLLAAIHQGGDVVDLVCVSGAAVGVDLAAVAVSSEDAEPEGAPLSATVSCHDSPVARWRVDTRRCLRVAPIVVVG